MVSKPVILLGALIALAACNAGGRPQGQPATARPAVSSVPGVNHRVAPGDTVSGIARSYGVTLQSVVAANQLSEPYVIYPGQNLLIPSVTRPQQTGRPVVPPSSRPTTTTAPPRPVVTAPSTGVKVPVSRSGVEEEVLTPQGGQVTANATPPASPPLPSSSPSVTPAQTPPSSVVSPTAGQTPAAIGTGNGATVVQPNTASSNVTPADVQEPEGPPATEGNGKFLWPASGKIIARFGVQKSGLRNDGINIAAPKGSPVRAAEAGTVIYAGNELKGFGNLLLVRHEGGWVTAYAHTDSILVKRGDKVKRGQTVARVGQTGNVTAPQLHFELRKGTQTVDPLPMLGDQGS